MCDQHFEEDLDNYLRRTGMTWRRFGALGVAMGLMQQLSPTARDIRWSTSAWTLSSP
jgi:hypothetical protein